MATEFENNRDSTYLFDLPLPYRTNTLLTAVAYMCYPQRNPPNHKGTIESNYPTCYSTIERLKSVVRKRRLIEEWSILEQARFQIGICLYGKYFHKISKIVKTKTTAECVRFYYECFKRTKRYQQWKFASSSATPTVKYQ
jgi:hypothetical protein